MHRNWYQVVGSDHWMNTNYWDEDTKADGKGTDMPTMLNTRQNWKFGVKRT
jgi:hypothetical protein